MDLLIEGYVLFSSFYLFFGFSCHVVADKMVPFVLFGLLLSCGCC
jgi:hypothetical protein